MWSSSMAGDAGRGCRSHQNVAVILALCTLVPSLTCFSLQRLSKNVKQDEVVNESTGMEEVWRGRINFNGKELDSQTGYASVAAAGNDGWLLSTDLDESDGSGMLEEAMGNEATWRRMHVSLQCGQNKMEFKATGPGTADLQLDMGHGHSLPLIQVPKTCKYSMKQNELGLVFVVPYNGCNVIQKDGNYVLPMRWLETPVKFTCPMLTSSTTTPAPTTLKSAQQPRNLPLPHGLWNLNRRKRHMNQPLSAYDLHILYYNLLNYYSMYMTTPAPTPDPATTKSDTTTMTTKPSTEKPPQMNPPAYPYNPYYYLFHYPYFYYPLPNVPMLTTTAPTTTAPTTTAPTTTAPTTTATTTPTTTPATSGVTSEVTTKTPRYPYYPPYPYPYYLPMGQQFPNFPNDAMLYYYEVIHRYYGNPPYPQIPSIPTPTTQPSTLTTNKPSNPTASPKPDDTTAQPSVSSPTTKQTTVSTPITKPSSNFVPYPQSPFTPFVLYKSNKAGKLPDDQKFLPHDAYKSVLGAKADPPPHPGFPYWHPVSWFSHFTGKNDDLPTAQNLQPSHF